MKKLLIIASLLFVLPSITNASTFVVTPSTGSYKSGDNITLQISVDPAGSTVYTAMLDAKFTPSTFEVVSFTMNDSMLTMKQNGYDSVNNTNGTLVKTGGYTGGINSVAPFGTLVLRAKGKGTGNFTINSTSKLLDVNNTNKQIGSQIASFIVKEKASVEVPVLEVKKLLKASTISTKEIVSEIKIPALNEVVTSTQTAAIGQPEKFDSTYWIIRILSIIVVFVVGYFCGSKKLFGF